MKRTRGDGVRARQVRAQIQGWGLATSLCVAMFGFSGCSSEAAAPSSVEAIDGTHALFDLSLDAAFYAAPFPRPNREREDGSLRINDFPNPNGNVMVQQMVDMLERGAQGFSTNGAAYLPFSGPLDPTTLPASVEESLAPESSVFLVNVDKASPYYGERLALEVSFKASAETYSPANVLVALPFQGFVLDPETLYAFVVTSKVRAADGTQLGSPVELEQLKRRKTPTAEADLPEAQRFTTSFGSLLDYYAENHLDASTIRAASVFRTGNAMTRHVRWREQIAARPTPAATGIADAGETYDDYCVVRASAGLPVFQAGAKPYSTIGDGAMVEDGSGELIEQSVDSVEILLTVPKQPMPSDGFPMLLYGAGGGGKARQIIDRTKESEDPDLGLGPRGQGPALQLARRGVAGLGFPAPLAWERNPAAKDGLVDFWNTGNLWAFRGNIQQGILDFTTLIEWVKHIEIPGELCPQASASTIRYDSKRLFVFGHSTGSTLGGAVIPLEKDVRGGVLSGAGGSWVYNLLLAEAPVRLKAVASLLLALDPDDELDRFDAPITLFQTAFEEVEMANWGRAQFHGALAQGDAKDLLLLGGITDPGHFPRMITSYAMAVGMDVAAPAAEPSVVSELALLGRSEIALPARGNVQLQNGQTATAVALQRDAKGLNGHHVAFEFDDVKHAYGCFIKTLSDDVQRVSEQSSEPASLEGAIATLPATQSDAAAPCE